MTLCIDNKCCITQPDTTAVLGCRRPELGDVFKIMGCGQIIGDVFKIMCGQIEYSPSGIEDNQNFFPERVTPLTNHHCALSASFRRGPARTIASKFTLFPSSLTVRSAVCLRRCNTSSFLFTLALALKLAIRNIFTYPRLCRKPLGCSGSW